METQCIVYPGLSLLFFLAGVLTWRIIPVSRWLVPPHYAPWIFGMGPTSPSLWDLLTNHSYYIIFYKSWGDTPSTPQSPSKNRGHYIPNNALLLMEEILHQLRCSLSVYPIYLQGFSTIPGGWPWDFWTINSIKWYCIHPRRLTSWTLKSWWFGSDDFPNFQGGIPTETMHCLAAWQFPKAARAP